MKALLTAIESALQSGLDYVRDGDVFVTPDDNYIPEDVRFPAVGLKDGGISRMELPGGMLRVQMDVKIILYVQLAKNEAAIMGDAAGGRTGILDMADDIHAILDENLLSITGMQEAYSPSDQESLMVGDENETMQRKILSYRYVKEANRP